MPAGRPLYSVQIEVVYTWNVLIQSNTYKLFFKKSDRRVVDYIKKKKDFRLSNLATEPKRFVNNDDRKLIMDGYQLALGSAAV
jgi:hypothetical protein